LRRKEKRKVKGKERSLGRKGERRKNYAEGSEKHIEIRNAPLKSETQRVREEKEREMHRGGAGSGKSNRRAKGDFGNARWRYNREHPNYNI